MRVFILMLMTLSFPVWASKPMDCGGLKSIDGVIEVKSFDCSDGKLCGVRLIAPETYDSLPFSSFTLMLGTYPDPELGAQLEYTMHGGIADVTILGHAETLSNYQVWAAYTEKGKCPRHSVAELGQHNKLNQQGPAAGTH